MRLYNGSKSAPTTPTLKIALLKKALHAVLVKVEYFLTIEKSLIIQKTLINQRSRIISSLEELENKAPELKYDQIDICIVALNEFRINNHILHNNDDGPAKELQEELIIEIEEYYKFTELTKQNSKANPCKIE